MAQKAYSLSHTKWMCKYHVVFTPKYRRKFIYNQIRSDLGEIFRKLCQYKGIEIIEGHLMPDHVHMLLAIPPKYSVSSVMGYLKGKSSLMIFDKHANMKYKFGNRKFWAEGYYVSTVGLNEATIAKYIREQEKADIAIDRLSVKEYEDPFDRGGRGVNSAGLTGPPRVNLQCGPNPVRAGAFRRVPEIQGLYPKSKPPLLGVVLIGGDRMRPGGTQTKHGAAVRMRRRLGLAPRACVLLSCSLVLVIAGVSAYGMTVPSMVQAHAARELHIGRKAKSDLGTTAGYTWASVVSHVMFGGDDADSPETSDNEVTLANGKTIVLTNTKIITKLSNNSVASVINKAEQQKGQDAQQTGKPGGSGSSGSSSDSSGGGSGSGSASGGGSSGDGSTDGGTGGDAGSGGLSAAEEESIHSWLVTKYNMLDGYVARANSVVSTYNATGDTGPCDTLANDMFVIRAEFGRQRFSTKSRWYRQYANLWGCYTNLCQWVGHYGDDDVALNNFNTNVAAIAL